MPIESIQSLNAVPTWTIGAACRAPEDNRRQQPQAQVGLAARLELERHATLEAPGEQADLSAFQLPGVRELLGSRSFARLYAHTKVVVRDLLACARCEGHKAFTATVAELHAVVTSPAYSALDGTPALRGAQHNLLWWARERARQGGCVAAARAARQVLESVAVSRLDRDCVASLISNWGQLGATAVCRLLRSDGMESLTPDLQHELLRLIRVARKRCTDDRQLTAYLVDIAANDVWTTLTEPEQRDAVLLLEFWLGYRTPLRSSPSTVDLLAAYHGALSTPTYRVADRAGKWQVLVRAPYVHHASLVEVMDSQLFRELDVAVQARVIDLFGTCLHRCNRGQTAIAETYETLDELDELIADETFARLQPAEQRMLLDAALRDREHLLIRLHQCRHIRFALDRLLPHADRWHSGGLSSASTSRALLRRAVECAIMQAERGAPIDLRLDELATLIEDSTFTRLPEPAKLAAIDCVLRRGADPTTVSDDLASLLASRQHAWLHDDWCQEVQARALLVAYWANSYSSGDIAELLASDGFAALPATGRRAVVRQLANFPHQRVVDVFSLLVGQPWLHAMTPENLERTIRLIGYVAHDGFGTPAQARVWKGVLDQISTSAVTIHFEPLGTLGKTGERRGSVMVVNADVLDLADRDSPVAGEQLRAVAAILAHETCHAVNDDWAEPTFEYFMAEYRAWYVEYLARNGRTPNRQQAYDRCRFLVTGGAYASIARAFADNDGTPSSPGVRIVEFLRQFSDDPIDAESSVRIERVTDPDMPAPVPTGECWR